jgi:Carboxypeptidase regulatory-like domain/TonB dependent receptor
MPRLNRGVPAKYCLLWLLFSLVVNFTWAQSETATVSGQVVDPSGLNISGAQVKLVDIDRDTSISVTTNSTGLYMFPSVRPGRYRMAVTSAGFKVVDVTDLIVNVQDHIEQNFRLQVGSVAESVTVTAGAPLVNTTDATVSTVVDRQFAENLPLNGRSFQSLIQLTPGVVLTANNAIDTGQFSVNGQRANSNYWTVDGVSANIGISASATPGSGLAGTLGSTSVLGGTNSLVSVDALQEFRIQTSTFAPEFGRVPGAQISIITRSGTNQFHSTVFDYLRNDALDANDWFNGVNLLNPTPLPKAKERQNDFGGTLGGPILKNGTFFFFSYEGLRLRLPQTALTLVPDTNPQDPFSRQFAQPALLPYVNAFPLPNGPEVLLNGNHQGVAQLDASFSDPGTLDAYSLRIDHKLSDNLNVFARYDYSPSKLSQRGGGSGALSTVSLISTTTQTATLGMTWAISTFASNDFRFNYSSTDSTLSTSLDNFGGAVPLGALPFPSPYTTRNAEFSFDVTSLGNNQVLAVGKDAVNRQQQLNFVDSLSLQKGTHGIKLGIDFRRLSPQFDPYAYGQQVAFSDMASAETGTAFSVVEYSNLPVTFLFRNLGVFAQDTWHVVPRLTLTYGLRWDIDFVPASLSGPGFPAVVGFNLSNVANLALAPAGTPPYKTTYGNVAPRIGLAYQVSQRPQWQTVLRGGFGIFYDLASSEAGNYLAGYPFGGFAFPTNNNFPLAFPALPSITAPSPTNPGEIYAFDPKLQLPYSLQWSAAVEQSLGKQQTLTASYIGASGRRLLQSAEILFPSSDPNPSLYFAALVTNTGSSDYNALQLQLHRQLSHGLQALASYTWSHSIDTASAGSYGDPSNLVSELNSNINRGASDFDIRNAFSMGLTYDVPLHSGDDLTNAVLRGWSIDNVVQARSAPPVDVYYTYLGLANGFLTNPRPDIVAGQAFYLYGPQYPGGKAFNPGAFAPPALDPATGYPLSQGDLPRNALRGFGATQWDFAVHRDFPIHESVKLQFRAEMFNVLNHPNFGPPAGNLGIPGFPNPQFGLSTQMLGKSLAGGNLGSGAFDPLYQVGGPRSVQFALKIFF